MKRAIITLWVFWFLFNTAWADKIKIGQSAPNFKLVRLGDTDSVSLSDFKGKVVLIDFWASWCAPCKMSMPLINDLANKYKSLEVVAINIDDDIENALRFLKDLDISLTTVYDSDKKVVEAYSVPEMPTAYLIDQYGKIQFIHSGYKKEDMRKLEFKIRGLLDRR